MVYFDQNLHTYYLFILKLFRRCHASFWPVEVKMLIALNGMLYMYFDKNFILILDTGII